jgi:hypothetical protein
MASPTKTTVDLPYVTSRYIGRDVLLDELGDLTEQELRLLETELDGVHQDCSASIKRLMQTAQPYGHIEKLLRVAGRFLYAIEREHYARQRHQSFFELTQELNAVKEDCANLRRQLDHLLASAK